MIYRGTAEEIRVGGDELLIAFFEEAFRMRVQHLVVLSPYVDAAAFLDSALRSSWEDTLASAESTIVVRTASAAEAVHRAAARWLPEHCDLRMNPNLHAKVFVAWRSGAEIALVGSHNLTAAALHTNKEIGILIKSRANAMTGIVRELRAIVGAVIRASSPYRGNPHPLLTGPRSRNDWASPHSRSCFDRATLRYSVI